MAPREGAPPAPSAPPPLAHVALLDLPEDLLLEILGIPSLAELPSSGALPASFAAARTCTRFRELAAEATTHLAIGGVRRSAELGGRNADADEGDVGKDLPQWQWAVGPHLASRVTSLTAHLGRLPRLRVVSLGAAADGASNMSDTERLAEKFFFVSALRRISSRRLNALILSGMAVSVALRDASIVGGLPLRSLCLRQMDPFFAGAAFATLVNAVGGSLESLAILDLDDAEEPAPWLSPALVTIRPLSRLTACCMTGPLSVEAAALLATAAPALTSLTVSDWRWTAAAVATELPSATTFPALTALTRRVASPLDHNGGDVSGWPRVQGGASGGVNEFVAARPALTRVAMVHVWGRREPDFGIAAGGGERPPG